MNRRCEWKWWKIINKNGIGIYGSRLFYADNFMAYRGILVLDLKVLSKILYNNSSNNNNKALNPITWGRLHESFSAIPRDPMPSYHIDHSRSYLSVLLMAMITLAYPYPKAEAWLILISPHFLTKAPTIFGDSLSFSLLYELPLPFLVFVHYKSYIF